jgi:predicted ATP-grasp superfamily ATP-dependent carboligase
VAKKDKSKKTKKLIKKAKKLRKELKKVEKKLKKKKKGSNTEVDRRDAPLPPPFST